MSTLSNITNGTGYQDGREPLGTDRWTYRGTRVAGTERIVRTDGGNLVIPAALRTNAGNGPIYVVFEYPGNDTATAQNLIQQVCTTATAAELGGFRLVGTDALTGNAGRYIPFNVNDRRGFDAVYNLHISPWEADIRGNNAFIAFAIHTRSGQPNSSSSETSRRWNEFISRLGYDLNRFELLDPLGGWQNFVFTLSTQVQNDLEVTGNEIVSTDTTTDRLILQWFINQVYSLKDL